MVLFVNHGDSATMIFEPSIISSVQPMQAYWFLFHENNLLISTMKSDITVPFITNPSDLGISIYEHHFFGMLDDNICFCAELKNPTLTPPNMELRDLRSLYEQIENGMYKAALRATQIVSWDRNHQFCGRCGSATVTAIGEYAKQCTKCGLMNYPRISPAIIVAIVKDKKLLLARRFNSQVYSVIAGYVEAGENLEECVHREVKEEVSIEVKNIKYFGSQPWAFSNSLMLAFTAEWLSGDVKVDGVELEEATWFTDNLPKIPSPLSISRKLINWYVETYK